MKEPAMEILRCCLAIGIVVLIAATIVKHKEHPERPFFQTWQSAEESCSNFCGSGESGYSYPALTGPGICVCNNENGKKVIAKYTGGNCK